jgi:hypothetical protein
LREKKILWGYTIVFDERKLGKTHFIMLIKRTNEKMDERVIEGIISMESEKLARQFGITIESSAYIHGEYDWMITFFADDILHAKNFSNKLMTLYYTGTEKITILQTMMFIRKHYVLNPEKQKLKEFL